MTAACLDPVVLEILRHRLDIINDDAAATLAQVSGSQIAVEANDMNTAVLTADGRVVSCGRFVLVLVVSLQHVVTDILENYGENPGIHPGDQFITNDPYVGTIHQPDVVVVAPVFVGDRLVAWTGSCVHHADVGGPVPGGINDAARSIYEEAVPIKPIKLVEGGTIRRDVEREFLGRSRRPDVGALDLLGQIAANRVASARLIEIAERSGADTLVDAMSQLLAGTGERFRALLRTLPDGRWRHTAYLEHEGVDPDGRRVANAVYAVRLTTTKRGADLELDFTTSDPQAPGAINASHAALTNFALAAVLIYLCGEIPWTAGAVHAAVRIVSRPGTVVHAEWPAGVAMSTASSGQAVRACVNACIARMLDASDAHAGWVMAGCQFAGGGGGVISGVDRSGDVFGTMTLDEISGGGGGRAFADGADTSGFTTSPGGACANVEVNEAAYPLLYLRRAEVADSGGPGRWRGGVGLETHVTPHRTSRPINVLSFGQGLQHPQAPGVVGGEPGGQSGFAIMATAVAAGLAHDGLPDRLPLPVAGLTFGSDEVHVAVSQGGGGLGDPLERPAERVAADLADGLISPEGARRDYGVVCDGVGAVDHPATERCRAERRRERIGRTPVPVTADRPIGRRISSHLVAVGTSDGERVVGACCGSDLAPVGGPLASALACREMPVGARGDFGGRYDGGDRFVVRHLYCPHCATQIDVQVSRCDEPVLETVDSGLGDD